MKKNRLAITCTLIFSGSILFSSCVGSFSLFNRFSAWNQNVSNKFVNELIFIVLQPVYAVCYMADAVVLNTIEFWTGSNPTANIGEIKKVKGENGEYLVERLENGYSITKDKKSMKLLFNETSQVWSMEAEGVTTPLFMMKKDGTADLFLPSGNSINITMDSKGLYAARQAVAGNIFFASR